MTRRRSVLLFALALLVAGLLVWLARGWSDSEGGWRHATMRAAEERAALPAPPNSEVGATTVAELPVITVDDSAPSVIPIATAGTATGSLLVHLRWEEDRSPATNIGLQLASWDADTPIFHMIQGCSDERGEWLVRDLPPGRVTVYSDRADSVNGAVVAGLTTELELVMPPGAWVRGEVIDGDGRAVPRASIWLSDYGNSNEGRVVMEADDAGRFELRGVGDGHFVGARAQGFTASAVHMVPREQTEVALTLELGPPGGELRGRVIDASGQPIAGAWILVGPENGWPAPDPHDRIAVERPPPLRATADAEGEFAVNDIPAGNVPVAARADGCGAWAGWDEIKAGFTLEIEITLPAGAIVAGTVHNESGQPVPGVDVYSGGYGDMDWVGTTSTADGSFELRSLRAGPQKITAFIEGGGRDDATLSLVAGERHEWNPVLAVGLQILGRIVDTTGAPMDGLLVQAELPEGGGRMTGTSDSQGRFVISNCADAAYTLTVHDFQSEPPVLGLVVVADVRPGPHEVVLTVPVGREPTARFVGRFEYDDGTPAGDVEAFLGPSGSNSVDKLELDAQGGFVSSPQFPGSYRVRVLQSGQFVVNVDDLQLEAGQTKDLGVIVVPKPGLLIVHVVRAPDVTADEVQCWARCPARNLMRPLEARPDGSYTSALQPGEYELRVEGKTLENRSAPFTIVAGRTVELTVAAARGIVCSVEIELPSEPAAMPTALARVLDDQGALVVESKMDVWVASQRRKAGRAIVLRPGLHRFQLLLDGELALDESMNVPDIGAEVAHFEWRLD